jgi:hypothetical protein
MKIPKDADILFGEIRPEGTLVTSPEELEKKKKVEKGTAEKRRKLYKIRHESDRKKIGTNGYYADKILW